MTDAVRCRRRDQCVTVIAAVVVTGARAARAGTLRGIESRVFAVLNGLDDRAFVPAWTVMQLGSLGGAITTGRPLLRLGSPASVAA